MIHLSKDAAIILYFTLVISLILLSWLLHLFKAKKKPVSFQTKVHTCEYCTATYMERISITTPKCPICGSYNSSR